MEKSNTSSRQKLKTPLGKDSAERTAAANASLSNAIERGGWFVIDLLKIFRAGFVRRWHTNPDLAHTCDRIDGHSARVARVILALHPDPSLELIRAALIHDDGESVVGDIPSGSYRRQLAAESNDFPNKMEDCVIADIWGWTAYDVDADHVPWLRFADRLDAYMWAAHHAPHVLSSDGWPEAKKWIKECASELLDGGSFVNLMCGLDEMEARHATP